MIHSNTHATFRQFFQGAPADIDVGSIFHEWQSVNSAYSIESRRPPQPVWGRREFNEDGAGAWEKLRRDIPSASGDKPFCIYIHVPFCQEKCAFCDCYSFRLANRKQEAIQAYITSLEREMRLWSGLDGLSQRPVSTVHFGGGTPTFLGNQAFARIVGTCREHFSMKNTVRNKVEWALETTSSELSGGIPDLLDQLGFTRVHVGIQTLDDAVRVRIGRRENAAAVLKKIANGVDRGWVISVDLIYGLPGQTLDSLLNDIQQLSDIGVDGLSLYILQISSRNQNACQRIGAADIDQLLCFFMIQAASQRLEHLGYRKTLFNHYAREKDTNLYFNFPERGEDCLGLGTIADGVFGDYHYRHSEYKKYLATTTDSFPGLQGGLLRTPLENLVQPLEVALLATNLPKDLFYKLLGPDLAQNLFEGWLGSALIRPDGIGHYRLTAGGSWLVGTMMQQTFNAVIRGDGPAIIHSW